MDSAELSEWQAYEREVGQFGTEWDREAIRMIHYELQKLQHLTAAFKTPQGKNNPVKEPKPIPRSNDFAKPQDDEQE